MRTPKFLVAVAFALVALIMAPLQASAARADHGFTIEAGFHLPDMAPMQAHPGHDEQAILTAPTEIVPGRRELAAILSHDGEPSSVRASDPAHRPRGPPD